MKLTLRSMTASRNNMETNNTKKIEGSWKFDEGVAEDFPDMLSRSIPGYDDMRELMFRMAKNFLQPYSNVLDIGCSTGLSSKQLVDCEEAAKCDFCLVDVSEPMLKRCRELYMDNRRVDVIKWDIREGCPVQRCSVVISCLTLQFVPIEYRQKVISSVYASLSRGGALFLVEKVIGNSNTIDEVMVKEYYNIKRENAYTEEQISDKRKALAGTLVPLTAEWNESMLRTAGFTKIDTFWRYLNFCGIIAVKN